MVFLVKLINTITTQQLTIRIPEEIVLLLVVVWDGLHLMLI
jgi:hypothetical protein